MSERDDIIDELHEIRRRLLEKHGGLHGFVQHLKDEAARSERPRITLPPRPVASPRPKKKSA